MCWLFFFFFFLAELFPGHMRASDSPPAPHIPHVVGRLKVSPQSHGVGELVLQARLQGTSGRENLGVFFSFCKF